MKLSYNYNTTTCLIAIKAYIPNKIGFDAAAADIDPASLRMIGYLILHHEEIHTVYFRHYNETIDFLDGNGFKVEGNDTDGYTISLLNN